MATTGPKQKSGKINASAASKKGKNEDDAAKILEQMDKKADAGQCPFC